MKRRNFLKWTVLVSGALAAGGGAVFVMTRRAPLAIDPNTWAGFSAADIDLMNAVANVVIPPTDSPGAGDLSVGAGIAEIVTDCYSLADRAAFAAGLRAMNDDCKARYGAVFQSLGAADRSRLVASLDREQLMQTRLQEVSRRAKRMAGDSVGNMVVAALSPDMQPHYFRQLKDMIVLTYCTSQRGASEAMRYVAVPGAYNGALPYKRGDRAWAT